MNVLLLSKYGRLGASSRLRSYQFLPYLRSEGLHVTVAPLLTDAYLENLYSGRRITWSSIVKSYGSRLRWLFAGRRFDLVWVEKECLPYCPTLFEDLLRPRRVPYAVDYDDAQFHVYDQHGRSVVRAVLGKKIDSVMRNAALVTAGNRYLRDHAVHAGATQVELLPTVVDVDRYARRDSGVGTPFVIGWMGTPKTVPLLDGIVGSLTEVARLRSVRIVTTGAPGRRLAGVPVETHAWSEATEASEIGSWDVGLMPLLDVPFQRGKCGYKLIQYMACALPVVASPVGVNSEIVEHGLNGFLATSPEDWVTSLITLIDDHQLAHEMGVRGRAKIEREFSLTYAAPQLAGWLKEAAERG